MLFILIALVGLIGEEEGLEDLVAEEEAMVA